MIGQAAPQVSDSSKRLGRIVKEVEALTRGVPLLVREVLQAAVERAPLEEWATQPLENISDKFAKGDGPYCQVVARQQYTPIWYRMATSSRKEQEDVLEEMASCPKTLPIKMTGW
ncbi:g7642 [Coccomyxa viridis]|uniref:G7642 protein n=1 Tax=Coccomyxa viridis TaxID=1274662 RepID=A0ABP1FYG5_9CHLO